MMRTNWQYLLLAFALAVFSWHLVSGREKVDTWIQVPVEMVNTPQGFVVRQGMVNRIEIRVRGPRPMLRTIDMRNAFYPLDLAGLEPGLNVLEFETRNIALSRAIEVVEISPSRVELLVDRLISKTVPVERNVEFSLHDDFELRRWTLNPAQVVVRGPQEIVASVDNVHTQLVRVQDDRPGFMESIVGLILPAEVEAQPARVTVQLEFGEKMAEVSLEVKILASKPTGMNVTVEPATLHLDLLVPVSLVRENKLSEGVQVATPPLGEFVPGEHEVGYRISLPTGVEVLQSNPGRVRVRIEEQTPEEAEGG